MFTSKFRTRSFLSLGIATLALAIGAASSFASAAVVDEAATAAAKEKMAACKLEYTSLRAMCQAEAGYGLVTRQDLTPEQRQALSAEDSRYRTLVAQCNRLPDNSRATCAERAGVPSILTGTERWQMM
ncbi:MAG TPA: hypothetical protein VLW55_24570 [Burkholderiaceae bacterium]|nr:hypothetical protein [Burkholderiaceae bacterium]